MSLNVLKNSSGDKAGLKGTKRDYFGRIIYGDIITSINDKKIKDNDDLISFLETKKAGEKVSIKFLRKDKEFGTTAILEEIKD